MESWINEGAVIIHDAVGGVSQETAFCTGVAVTLGFLLLCKACDCAAKIACKLLEPLLYKLREIILSRKNRRSGSSDK